MGGPASWHLRLSAEAEHDFIAVFRWTAQRFGILQARRYRGLILSAIEELQAGPDLPGSKARDEILPGVRTLHVARRGRPARHFLIYRAVDGRIEILRILHDSMELSRHLPGPAADDEPEG